MGIVIKWPYIQSTTPSNRQHPSIIKSPQGYGGGVRSKPSTVNLNASILL